MKINKHHYKTNTFLHSVSKNYLYCGYRMKGFKTSCFFFQNLLFYTDLLAFLRHIFQNHNEIYGIIIRDNTETEYHSILYKI